MKCFWDREVFQIGIDNLIASGNKKNHAVYQNYSFILNTALAMFEMFINLQDKRYIF